MFKRYFPCVLGLAASLALGGASFAQEEAANAPAAQPASLSLSGLMGEEPEEAAKPAPLQIDEELLKVPEEASFDEYFEFVEGLQEKLPQPQSQEDVYTLVDALSKTYLNVANKLLAMEGLTDEQVERATQLKVVALTTRANVDPDAAKELTDFVEENLAKAKTDDALIKAYQLKLQVLSASEEDPIQKIEALADEMFAREEVELQVFAIEVKAQAFLTTVQKSGVFDEGILKFTDGVVGDEKRDAKVKEKAYEMKLVALVIASELENGKEDESERNPEYAKQAEELFAQLLDGDFSLDLKKMVYQLRVQTLMDAVATDDSSKEKLNALVEKLAKEEDSELYALGVSVKGQLLLDAASALVAEDPDAAANSDEVKALAEYAAQIAEEVKTKPELQEQAIGLNIQALRLSKDNDGLFKYVDEQLAAEPNADIKDKLIQVKLSLVTEAVSKDPETFDSYKDFFEEVKQNEALADRVSQIYSARFVGVVSKLAENQGSLEDLAAAVKQFEEDLVVAPRSVTALLMARAAIDEIGKANSKPELFDETFQGVIDFCKKAESEDLNTLAQNLEFYMMQMRQQQEQAAEEAAKAEAKEAAPEEKAEEPKAEAPKAEETKAPVKEAAAKAPAKNAAKPAAKPAAKSAAKAPAKAAPKKK